ncbi:Por secretion system C-terminal sorting domain-containing protein [Reichenbachiella faecimaris]|uniref:Por secretion system C-terminal sorting domain-containing protein n=1 Tax=Reichenbachiella faecimaris TaxID=692418 RepID=A0A1W2G600_REIFA|nr:T9SS type A sorting domain-containing protein [Reichenbachiella faecimaris]SMD32021.1 Por secretion system C-terminal sorting domain-containing protein [Reichenbachiella faecimaris]
MHLNVCRFGLILGFVLIVQSSYAQLQVRNINRMPRSPSLPSNARVKATGDTILLPFWDDFSFSSITPDSILWESNTGVLINGTQGKSSPTLNVASFDGADIFGNPHNPSGVNSELVDVLTSRHIDLSGIPVDKWDSVFFSFYWQMGGLAEVPEQRDALIVEFLDRDEVWNEVFNKSGVEENLHDVFMKEPIQLTEEYFHAGFQFRFKATGNSLGPYDAWHIDYVYLNIDRYKDNESIRDGAIASTPTSIFSEYTRIPYDVLFNFPDTIYKPIEVELSTFKNVVHLVFVEATLRDTLLNQVLDYQDPSSGDIALGSFARGTFISDEDQIISSADLMTAPTDSLFLELEMIFDTKDEYFVSEETNSGSVYFVDDSYNYRLNDTVRTYHEVHHTLAYDDGSAEYAAGLNKYESQLGIYFNIPSEDTLTAVDIYFPQFSKSADDPVSPTGKEIVLSVLKDLSGSPNSVVRSQEFVIPGSAQLNEFNRFTFDLPIILSGGFYISLQQFTSEYIGIGLDNNSLLGKQKIFVNIEDEWEPNLKVEGMVMVRAIFEDSDFVVSDVRDFNEELKLFPNPVNDMLTIQGSFDQYELMDLSGKVLMSGNAREFSVSALMNGVYFIKIRIGESTSTRKIVIRH